MNNGSLNTAQRLVVIIMDVLLLSELCVCMYLSHRTPDNMVPVFLKTYVPAAILTLVGARLLIRRLGSPKADPTTPNTTPEGV